MPPVHQDKKRVKVYELRNNDWFDRGTGFCTAKFVTSEDGRKEPKVIVESEDQPERLLLETTIQKQDGFQKQQETLIVWQEPDSGVDMALSFQEAEGCAMIWRFVNTVQQTLQHHAAGVDDALSDDLAIEPLAPVSLPVAELGNLVEIETSIRVMSSTATGREAITKFIMTDDYIGKLIPLVEIAEDLESLPDLHRLCSIMKSILLLNDTSIIEHAVSDECLMGVVGALEYDPDFPSHKANHRHWLSNQVRFQEVVHIDDEAVRRKIHQTYRLQYLKDVVLARIIDDATFSVLNSLIFFNHVEIVQHLQSNPAYLINLFGIFSAHYPDTMRRKEAVLFIQQCCGVAKTLQDPARQQLFLTFLNHGLLRVVYYGLQHVDVAVRIGATEILMAVIDRDAVLIRQSIFRQMQEGTSTLVDSLIELLLVEADLGVQAQLSDCLRVILNQENPQARNETAANNNNQQQGGEPAPRPRVQPLSDSQYEEFLERFYDTSALKLFKPLIDYRGRVHFDVQKSTKFFCLMELLGFFIRQHHRFAKYFFVFNHLASPISKLLACKDKFLQLVSIRCFRFVVETQAPFYIRNLIQWDVMGKILRVLVKTIPRDNLVSAACMELFDFLKKDYLMEMVKHLVENHRSELLRAIHIPPCRELIERYDQTDGYNSNMDYFADTTDEDVREVLARTKYWDGPEDEDQVPLDGSPEATGSFFDAAGPEEDQVSEVSSIGTTSKYFKAQEIDRSHAPSPEVRDPRPADKPPKVTSKHSKTKDRDRTNPSELVVSKYFYPDKFDETLAENPSEVVVSKYFPLKKAEPTPAQQSTEAVFAKHRELQQRKANERKDNEREENEQVPVDRSHAPSPEDRHQRPADKPREVVTKTKYWDENGPVYWAPAGPDDWPEILRRKNPGQSSTEKPSDGGASSSRPLVDYSSDEDEEGNDADDQSRHSGGRSRPRRGRPSQRSEDKKRMPEKRRREEEDDDDDELSKLMQSKRRNSSSAESNSSLTHGLKPRRKSMNSGGKIAISLSPALRSGGPSQPVDNA